MTFVRPSRLARGGRASFGVLLLLGCRGGEPPPARPAAAVIAAHAESLLALPGVVGLYQGLGARGDTVLRVMLVTGADSTRRRLPRRLEGWRVEVEVGGRIEPM